MSANDRDLSSIRVRCLSDDLEKERWRQMVRLYHPLGFQGMVGEQLYYVAEDDLGNWVACLGWSAAARHLKDRESLIGWKPMQMRQRLHLVANNGRFLVLPGYAGWANLASRVLGLCSQVISDDWQTQYGHPIWLLETFVEQEHLGTCYKACGWQEVGKTKGYRRNSKKGYCKHGIEKRYFVRTLHKQSKDWLASRRPLPEDRPLPYVEPLVQPIAPDPSNDHPGLLELIAQEIQDPRSRHGKRFRLETILAILILGMLAGEKTCAGVARWAKTMPDRLRKELRCVRGSQGRAVPSANTYRYALQELPPDQLDHLVQKWCSVSGINLERTHLAIDGKVLRGSKEGEKQPLAQLNVYDTQKKLVVDQIAIPEKTNEITAIRTLIDRHQINDSIVTMDAAHTNPTTMRSLVEKGGSRFASSKGIRLDFTSGLKKPLPLLA
jgi:hypothetical protein